MALSVKATVKDLPVKLQNSSLNQRKKLFADLVKFQIQRPFQPLMISILSF